MNMHGLIDKLNDPDREARLDALKELYRLYQNGDIARDQVDYEYVNNHIHTTYSFPRIHRQRLYGWLLYPGLKPPVLWITTQQAVSGNLLRREGF